MNAPLKRLTTPIPRSLRTRPRDSRGYPIPFVVVIDNHKQPQFTINDHERVLECARKGLCALCGKRFISGLWFIGGPKCFLHELGAFLDPPAHLECAEYALRVCPYLAAPSYARRIDDRKMTAAAIPDGMIIVKEDAMPDYRPPLFVLGHAYESGTTTLETGQLLYIPRHWRYIEFWRHGSRLTITPDARAAIAWSVA